MTTTRTTPDTHTAHYVLIVCTDEDVYRRYAGLLSPIGTPGAPISWDDLRPEALAWAQAHGYDPGRLDVYVADGTDLGDRYTDETRYGAYRPFPHLFIEVEQIYADRMRYQVEVAAPPSGDVLLEGGVDHGDWIEWQAAGPSQPCTQIAVRGVPRQMAEYISMAHASEGAEAGDAAGTRYRTTITHVDGTPLATSGVHTVERGGDGDAPECGPGCTCLWCIPGPA